MTHTPSCGCLKHHAFSAFHLVLSSFLVTLMVATGLDNRQTRLPFMTGYRVGHSCESAWLTQPPPAAPASRSPVSREGQRTTHLQTLAGVWAAIHTCPTGTPLRALHSATQSSDEWFGGAAVRHCHLLIIPSTQFLTGPQRPGNGYTPWSTCCLAPGAVLSISRVVAH